MIGKIFVIVLGAVLLFFGIRGQKKRSAQLKSGDFKEITGTVIDFKEELSTDTDENGFTTTSRVYYPIYEYTVDNQKYTYTGKVGTSFKRGLGKQATLLYNTKDPKECISPKDKTNILTIVLGIALILIGIYTLTI